MTEILLPTKATQEAIKTSTDLIGTANPAAGGTGNLFAFLKLVNDYVDTLEGLVGTANPTTGGTDTLFKYLKKLDTYFPISGGTDWSKYSPLSVITHTANFASNETKQIVNVSGSGYLSLAVFKTDSDYKFQIRITIDGQVVHLTNNNNNNTVINGLASNEYICKSEASASLAIKDFIHGNVVGASPYLAYPNTANVSGIAVIDKPLFFKQSLLVEVINTTTYGSTSVYANVMGGIG